MATPNSIVVVKIGGSTLGAGDTSLADVVTLHQSGTCPVVVHGGGPAITQWMAKLGVRAEFIGGLRVTDAEGLEVVTAVLAGLVNKTLVAALSALGGRAVGLSGADGHMLIGAVDQPSLGFVAGSVEVDTAPIQAVVDAGYIPVIAPLAMERAESGSHPHQLLNVNADTAAGAIAEALGAAHLVFLTDVDGVLDTNGRLIHRVSSQQGQGLMGSGAIKGGMIPKVEASLRAAAKGTPSHIVNGTKPSTLMECLQKTGVGTLIV